MSLIYPWSSAELKQIESYVVSEEILHSTSLDVRRFQDLIGSIESYTDRIQNLPRMLMKPLHVFDLDDTLYSRQWTLQHWILSDNRWYAWNKIIKERWGYESFVDTHYGISWRVKLLIYVLLKERWIILTAWDPILQMMKINAMQLNKQGIPIIIVNTIWDKPRWILDHIIEELWYIPSSITVYDDRVNDISDGLSSLAQFLRVPVNSKEICLSQTETNKIESIRSKLIMP